MSQPSDVQSGVVTETHDDIRTVRMITPDRVKEVLRDPSLLRKWTDEQLLDDHRICHLWAGKNWKTLPHELTKQEVKRFHDLLVEEMRRRGFEHHTPIKLSRPTYAIVCLLYTSPSPRDLSTSRMPSSA